MLRFVAARVLFLSVTIPLGYLLRLPAPQVATPGQTATNSASDASADTFLKPIEQHGKWGYARPDGTLVIKPKYFAVQPFLEGYALVATGKPPWWFAGTGYLFRSDVTWIDHSGTPIRAPLSVEFAGSFHEGRAAAVPFCMSCLGGYIDTLGQWAIKPRFKSVRDFSEVVAAVQVGRPSRGLYGQWVGKWGYIDKNGNFVVAPKFDDAASFSEGLAAVNIGEAFGRGGKWGYIDKNGVLVIQPQFASVGDFHDGRASALDKKGRFKWIGRNGETAPNQTCDERRLPQHGRGVGSILRCAP